MINLCCFYLSTVICLWLQLPNLDTQALEKVVLLVADLVGHGGLLLLQKKLQIDSETGHVYGKLTSTDKGVVETDNLARLTADNGRRETQCRQQTDRKHGNNLCVTHLLKDSRVVGVVIVGKVDDAFLRGARIVFAKPFKSF